MTLTIDHSHKSPNHAPRGGHAIRMLVLHATVGDYQDSLDWLCNPVSRVSSHYLIRKDGHTAQLVDDTNVAWHAGKSAWMGLDSDDIALCSLGIELENANTGRDPYPVAQLSACRELCRSLIASYHIERPYVTRHLDIAIPRGRKTDPAGFPWPQFADSLYAPIAAPPIGHYRVLDTVTGGATIRAAPRITGAVLGRLHAGDPWVGDEVEAKTATFVKDFGSSRIWVRSIDMRYVWRGLLEKVRPI